MTHSLTIYHISVNPRRKRNERFVLSDIEGQSLYSLTDQFLKSWLIQGNSIQNSEKLKKVSRIGINGSKPIYFPTGDQIYGIIESGEYGQEMDVININDGSLKHTILQEEASMIPFFFLFHLPEDSKDGFLILQKNGNVGIQTILTSEYVGYLEANLKTECTIKIQPFAISALINKNLLRISEAKSIIIKNKGLNIFDQVGLGLLEDNGVCSEVKYTLGKNRLFDISKWLPKVMNKETPEKDENVLPISSTDICLEVKMPNGDLRKLSLGNLSNIGTSLTLPKDIPLNSKGYPRIDDMRNEAMKLLDYIDPQQ